jgi:DDE superfamily endonuclease
LSNGIITVFESMLQALTGAFNVPSGANFTTLMRGLVLCLGRPTVRNLLRATDGEVKKHETSYHRFYSRAVWTVDHLSELLIKHVVIPRFGEKGRLRVCGDDTTAEKTGRKVAFASMFRDAIASTGKKSVTHWSHNWVILCLIVPSPFAKERLLHIPLMARLYRIEKHCKRGPKFRSRHELLVEMVKLLSKWVDGRLIELSADGAYASSQVIGSLPKNVVFTSRIRKDAGAVSNARAAEGATRTAPAQRRKVAEAGRNSQEGKVQKHKGADVWRAP